jgi:hypothetical protein
MSQAVRPAFQINNDGKTAGGRAHTLAACPDALQTECLNFRTIILAQPYWKRLGKRALSVLQEPMPAPISLGEHAPADELQRQRRFRRVLLSSSAVAPPALFAPVAAAGLPVVPLSGLP